MRMMQVKLKEIIAVFLKPADGGFRFWYRQLTLTYVVLNSHSWSTLFYDVNKTAEH